MFDVKKTDANLVALKKFFGFKDGQTLKEFSEEIKQLSKEEQDELGNAVRELYGV